MFVNRLRKAKPRQRNAPDKTRRRKRNAPTRRPQAAQNPTAYRAAAQSGKNGYMVTNTMYSTHFYGLEKNSKRREVTVQREREGLRLTLKLSQAGCGYIPKLGL